jgi:hypothetical protein
VAPRGAERRRGHRARRPKAEDDRTDANTRGASNQAHCRRPPPISEEGVFTQPIFVDVGCALAAS